MVLLKGISVLLRTKLILIFSLMTLLLMLVGACGFLFSVLTRRQAERMAGHGIPAMRVLAEGKGHLWTAMFASGEGEADESFQALESAILDYGGHSLHPDKVQNRKRMMRRVLELQEDQGSLSPTGCGRGWVNFRNCSTRRWARRRIGWSIIAPAGGNGFKPSLS